MRNDAVFVKTTPQGLLAPACAAPFFYEMAVFS